MLIARISSLSSSDEFLFGQNYGHRTIGDASPALAGCGSAGPENAATGLINVDGPPATSRRLVLGSPGPLTCRHMAMTLASRKLFSARYSAVQGTGGVVEPACWVKAASPHGRFGVQSMAGRPLSNLLPRPSLETGLHTPSGFLFVNLHLCVVSVLALFSPISTSIYESLQLGGFPRLNTIFRIAAYPFAYPALYFRDLFV